jgi:hypothetical protein
MAPAHFPAQKILPGVLGSGMHSRWFRLGPLSHGPSPWLAKQSHSVQDVSHKTAIPLLVNQDCGMLELLAMPAGLQLPGQADTLWALQPVANALYNHLTSLHAILLHLRNTHRRICEVGWHRKSQHSSVTISSFLTPYTPSSLQTRCFAAHISWQPPKLPCLGMS